MKLKSKRVTKTLVMYDGIVLVLTDTKLYARLGQNHVLYAPLTNYYMSWAYY